MRLNCAPEMVLPQPSDSRKPNSGKLALIGLKQETRFANESQLEWRLDITLTRCAAASRETGSQGTADVWAGGCQECLSIFRGMTARPTGNKRYAHDFLARRRWHHRTYHNRLCVGHAGGWRLSSRQVALNPSGKVVSKNGSVSAGGGQVVRRAPCD